MNAIIYIKSICRRLQDKQVIEIKDICEDEIQRRLKNDKENTTGRK